MFRENNTSGEKMLSSGNPLLVGTEATMAVDASVGAADALKPDTLPRLWRNYKLAFLEIADLRLTMYLF